MSVRRKQYLPLEYFVLVPAVIGNKVFVIVDGHVQPIPVGRYCDLYNTNQAFKPSDYSMLIVVDEYMCIINRRHSHNGDKQHIVACLRTFSDN